MDLTTRYLGLDLAHPFVPGASPLGHDLDRARQLEDAGAAALVMPSLFEEQLTLEELATVGALTDHGDLHPEAASYLPRPDAFALGPDDYLERIGQLRAALAIPVIASLNGTTRGGWLEHARLIEEAGAAALELNIYEVVSDPARPGADVEAEALAILAEVKRSVTIPVAVKLSPYLSSVAHFAHALDTAGADGLVLFNRFYQPDIDVEELELWPALHLSDPGELLLRLRWLAVLSGTVNASLAVSGGVHGPLDAVKAVMAGAHVVQVVSAVLRHGPQRLDHIRTGFEQWMEEHEYASLTELRGCMDLTRCPNPAAYARANYLKVLQSWEHLETGGRPG